MSQIEKQIRGKIYQGETPISDELLVIDNYSKKSPITRISRGKFDDFKSNSRKIYLRNKKVLDFNNGIYFRFDGVGDISDADSISQDDYIYSPYLNSPSTKEFLSEPDGDVESGPNVKIISLDSALEMIKSPAKFRKNGSILTAYNESKMDKLLKMAIINPGQFDEIFTVDVDTPESPLMRNYLKILSELILEEMSKVEDSSIDNIEDLEKIAYERAGYQGKELETVKQESKDYHRHFRYLLTKGEKVSVTEKQVEYFNDIVSLSKNLHFEYLKYKGNNLDYEINGYLSISKLFNFNERIPSFSISKDKLVSTYFLHVDDIFNMENEVEQSIIPLKVSAHNEILSNTFKDKFAAGVKIDVSIIVSDKNLNLVKFSVKASTLVKWKKRLKDELMYLDTSDKSSIPAQFASPYL